MAWTYTWNNRERWKIYYTMKKGGSLKKVSDYIGILFLCIILIMVYLYRMRDCNILYIIGDEYGYWANAAYMNGFDWTGVSQHNSYYSYGYSFILVPLFWIKNFELRYQVALMINILFQLLSFILLSIIGKKIFENDFRIISFVSFVVTLYTANIFQAKTTLAESILYFIYVLIIYLALLVYKNCKLRDCFLLSFFAVYIFTVHMRAIGITVSVIAFLLLLLFQHKEHRKKIGISLVCVIVLMVLGIFVKNHIVSSIYLSNNTTTVNDFSGQINKLQLLCSLNGIKLFVRSFLGKMFYLFAASYLLLGWFIIWLVHKIIMVIKRAVEEKYIDEWCFFFFLSIILTLFISALYMISESNIEDYLIYGRYNEFILGPILMIAINVLLEKKELKWKSFFLVVLVFLLLTVFVHFEFEKIDNPVIREANIAGIVYMAFDGENCLYSDWEIVIALKAICWGTCLFASRYLHSEKKLSCIVVCITGIIWFVSGDFLVERQLDIRKWYASNMVISEYITEKGIKKVSYITNQNYVDMDMLYPDIIQYMNPEVEVIYEEESSNNVVLLRKGKYNQKEYQEYTLVITSDMFDMYVMQ